jgi:DNA-binding SARP family transcriptional activator
MPPSISKTYISILGELRVISINATGEQEVRAIGGVVPRALLAALVFNRKPLQRLHVFQQVWDLPPTNISRIHERTKKLRNELGDRDLIPNGKTLGLLRDSNRLQTDWDLFHQLITADPPRQREAIALVHDIPLARIRQ